MKIDLLRVEPEKDEELAAWLDSLNSHDRDRLLLCSVRGISQGGKRPSRLDNKHSTRVENGRRSSTYFKRPVTHEGTTQARCSFDPEVERRKWEAMQAYIPSRNLTYINRIDTYESVSLILISCCFTGT